MQEKELKEINETVKNLQTVRKQLKQQIKDIDETLRFLSKKYDLIIPLEE